MVAQASHRESKGVECLRQLRVDWYGLRGDEVCERAAKTAKTEKTMFDDAAPAPAEGEC